MNARSRLLWAIKENYYQSIPRLINDIDLKEELENNKTAIQIAAGLKYWHCVKAIASHKKTDTEDRARYGDALLHAVSNQQFETAKFLLEARASHTWFYDDTGDWCLHLAVRNRNVALIALLLSFNFKLSSENKAKQTPMVLAYTLGFQDCIDALNLKFENVLMTSVSTGQLSATKFLLERGTAPDCFDEAGNGLLHIAIKQRNTHMIQLLLSFNVNLTKENKAKRTPIQLACDLGFWDCIEVIAKNHKVDAKDEERFGDVLLRAVDQQKIDAATTLLASRASLGWTFDINKENCLHTAVRKHNQPLITLLLSYGVNLDEKNKKHQTAFDVAKELNLTGLYEAWKNYFNKETLAITNCLTLFAQGQRQAHNILHRTPSKVLEYTLSFLSRETKKHDTLYNENKKLFKISAEIIVNHFSKYSDPETKNFVTNLKNILKNSSNLFDDSVKEINSYLLINPEAKTKILGLVDKYKLLPLMQEKNMPPNPTLVS